MQDSKTKDLEYNYDGDDFGDSQCLWTVGINSEGRQSLAFQSRSTGQLTTWSELKGGFPQPFFRKIDSDLCWLLSEDWSPGTLRSIVMWFRLLVFLARSFLEMLGLVWDGTRQLGPYITQLPRRLVVFPYKLVSSLIWAAGEYRAARQHIHAEQSQMH